MSAEYCAATIINGRVVYLDELVMGRLRPGETIVHLNGDMLDCRRANMVVVRAEEPVQKRRMHRKKRVQYAQ